MSSKTIGFANSEAESIFQRHAWKVLLFFGFFTSLIGLPDLLAGGSFYNHGDVRMLQAITGMTWEQLEATSPNAAAMIDFQVKMGACNTFSSVCLAWRLR